MGWRTTPSPVQVGQSSRGLLNEKFAMPISGTAAAQCGQGCSVGAFVGLCLPIFVRFVGGRRDVFSALGTGAKKNRRQTVSATVERGL